MKIEVNEFFNKQFNEPWVGNHLHGHLAKMAIFCQRSSAILIALTIKT